jgi:DNA-binding NarL/FixJ family response regulator
VAYPKAHASRRRAYRGRKERAQLHAAGKSIKEIAQELQSNTKTVKGWINNRKG